MLASDGDCKGEEGFGLHNTFPHVSLSYNGRLWERNRILFDPISSLPIELKELAECKGAFGPLKQVGSGRDRVGRLQSFAYPNGVTTAYTYYQLNALDADGGGGRTARRTRS
jgi:hypothetical protein